VAPLLSDLEVREARRAEVFQIPSSIRQTGFQLAVRSVERQRRTMPSATGQ